MPPAIRRRIFSFLFLAFASIGCGDKIPNTSSISDRSPTIVHFDPTTPLLDGVPWPNDSLCRPPYREDEPCYPNVSTTGLPTVVEGWVASVNNSRGWPTTSSIFLPFERATDAFFGPAIDLSRFLTSQRDYDFTNDAIYLIDLTTGLPVALDFGNDLTSFILEAPIALDPSDPHRDSPSIIVETEDERYDDVSHAFVPARMSDNSETAVPMYSPDWDRDSDGLLDVPVYEHGQHCSETQLDTQSSRAERARCLADNLIPFYEPVRDQLRIRPRTVLRENTPYALVVTNRLLDNRQRSIGSPFAAIFHPTQEKSARRVEAILSNPNGAEYYGSLAGTGLSDVRFLFKFTTASPVSDFRSLSEMLAPPSARTSVEFFEPIDLDEQCGTQSLRARLLQVLASSFKLDLGEQAALKDALTSIARLLPGQFDHPQYTSFDGDSLHIRQEPSTQMVSIPLMLTIPKDVSKNRSLPTVILNHDVKTNRFDGLRSAGQAASLGLSYLVYDRVGAMSPFDSDSLESLRKELQKEKTSDCARNFARILLAERSDNADILPSPLSIDVLSTQARWLASSVELGVLTKTISHRENDDGRAPNAPELDILGSIGQGEGAAIAGLAATLPVAPKTLVVVDPTTTPSSAWARGMTWGTAPTDRLDLFGPRIAGVLASSIPAVQTQCSDSETSLRLVSSTQQYLGHEVGCLPLRLENNVRFPEGATVVVTNLRSFERRCVGMTNLGEFSLGIPTHAGDSLELLVFDGRNAVRRFGRNADCELSEPGLKPQLNLTVSNAVKSAPWVPTGLGLERQSIELKNTIAWADVAFGKANPTTFFAALGQKSAGENAVGSLIILSPGDPLVSPSEGLAIAVASGLVPYLPPEFLADRKHFDMAADTTPSLLFQDLGQITAQTSLSMGHLAESAPWLMRHDPAPVECGINRVASGILPEICQPDCQSDTDCPKNSLCIDQRCETAKVSRDLCGQYLFDFDHLAGDAPGTNEQTAVIPTRLTRYAGTIDATNLAALWLPRTSSDFDNTENGPSTPGAPNWPLTALALPLSDPRGGHGIPMDNVCQRFRFGSYLPHLIARFFLSRARSYSPVSDGKDQSCLALPNAQLTCPFLGTH
jgi:hypothetical protein